LNEIKNDKKKIALGIQYDGSAYHGWQFQKTVSSVQEELENAISRISNHKVNVTCAGRTDAGVHSMGQVVHFKTNSVRKESSWTMGVNTYLSKYISVQWVREVPIFFNARSSAIDRSYRYIIYNNTFRSGIFHNQYKHVYKKLDEFKMNSASQYLLGEHDFTSFRAVNCQSKSPWKKIKKLHVWRCNNLVIIDITANSFLYHMVRNIVGSLIEIGTSKRKKYWIKELLNKRNRIYGGPTVEPQGLYLFFVKYPDYFNLPKFKNNFTFFI